MRDDQTNNHCQLVTVASGPLARVDRCADCGTITLHLGAVSLRLDRAAAESLWSTLGLGLSAPAPDVRGKSRGDDRLAH